MRVAYLTISTLPLSVATISECTALLISSITRLIGKSTILSLRVTLRGYIDSYLKGRRRLLGCGRADTKRIAKNRDLS